MRVLILDDSRSSIAMIGSTVRAATDAEVDACLHPHQGLELTQSKQYDLLLVDHIMPDMDGIEFTRALRQRDNYLTVPVIMVTSDMDRDTRVEAIRAGATDFVGKPFDPNELQARVSNLLALRSAQVKLADRAAWLSSEVNIAMAHLLEREEETIWRLARAIEYRDGDTGEHVSRVALISRLIASAIGLTPAQCHTIYLAAPLHDVGKIAIADAILGKPGKLTPDELARMREHVTIGARILGGGTSELIKTAELIALSHHERWDGAGYPDQLSGTDIPVGARVVAIADVFDALCSERPYKKAWPLDKAYAEIVACSGTHFDPTCVQAFRCKWPEIEALMLRRP